MLDYSFFDLMNLAVRNNDSFYVRHYDSGHRINITSDEEAYRIYLQTPGFPKSTLSIQFDKLEEEKGVYPIIILKGNLEPVAEKIRYHVQEFVPAGEFERKFKLPADADTDEATASYTDGVLYVRIPRKKINPIFKTLKIW